MPGSMRLNILLFYTSFPAGLQFSGLQMIAQLRGTIIDLHGSVLTVDVGGVGYEVFASRALVESSEIGVATQVLIYTDVKEDSIRLFGFADSLEKQVFLLLLKVSGVGSKTALEIISGMDGRELLRAIGAADSHRLQSVRGIGKKTAERIILELRDRMAAVAEELQGEESGSGKRGAFLDAIQALRALGFSQGDAETAVRAAEQSGKLGESHSDPGAIVKEALRFV